MGMHNWFEASIKYEKMMENGKEKKVTERYLIDALVVQKQKHVLSRR